MSLRLQPISSATTTTTLMLSHLCVVLPCFFVVCEAASDSPFTQVGVIVGIIVGVVGVVVVVGVTVVLCRLFCCRDSCKCCGSCPCCGERDSDLQTLASRGAKSGSDGTTTPDPKKSPSFVSQDYHLGPRNSKLRRSKTKPYPPEYDDLPRYDWTEEDAERQRSRARAAAAKRSGGDDDASSDSFSHFSDARHIPPVHGLSAKRSMREAAAFARDNPHHAEREGTPEASQESKERPAPVMDYANEADGAAISYHDSSRAKRREFATFAFDKPSLNIADRHRALGETVPERPAAAGMDYANEAFSMDDNQHAKRKEAATFARDHPALTERGGTPEAPQRSEERASPVMNYAHEAYGMDRSYFDSGHARGPQSNKSRARTAAEPSDVHIAPSDHDRNFGLRQNIAGRYNLGFNEGSTETAV